MEQTIKILQDRISYLEDNLLRYKVAAKATSSMEKSYQQEIQELRKAINILKNNQWT